MAPDGASGLVRGDLLPEVRVPPPGPRSRALSARLATAEAPGVNTLYRGEPAVLWEEARGANVLDADGNRYLDLTSGFGVAAVGHRHPRVVEAVRRQSGRLLHALGDVHGHPLRVELAERLAALAPVADGAVYPAISGSEAVEVALKTALLATGRPGVVAFAPGYHGLTLGALALTSRPAFRAPFTAHLHPHLRRLPHGCGEDVLEPVLAAGDVACVVVEPVVGREGVIFPPEGWLVALHRLCRRHGVLLVADEVFTGFGRTGRWFAVDHDDLRPDLLVCGKALGGGLPIAAVVGDRALLETWRVDGEAIHTATFIANPLACAAAMAVLDVLDEDDLPARAAGFEAEIGERLGGWPQRFAAVTATRGRGLLWGVELATAEAAAAVARSALARGLLLLAGGAEGTVVQLVPPLTITRRQLHHALDLLEELLAQPPAPRREPATPPGPPPARRR